ncbi:MAG: tetratricopeptide repeat protein [Gammaproteobacteria bacterium]|nr:tetratricopeptide repeat protein [Gammaproteobacteria bacterium]
MKHSTSGVTKQQIMGLIQSQQFPQAQKECSAFCEANPSDDEAWVMLGGIYCQMGDFVHSERYFFKAIELQGNNPIAWYNLGLAQLNQKKYQEAIQSYQKTLQLHPQIAMAYHDMGSALHQLGRYEEAIDNLATAVHLNPGFDSGHFNLAIALADAGRTRDAEQSYKNTLKFNPQHAMAANNLGNLCMTQGRLKESEDYYQQALNMQPGYHVIHSNRLFCLNYHADYDAQASLAAHQQWDQKYCAGITAIEHDRQHADSDKVLRIAYISPDLCAHSVAFFLEPLLQHHNRNHVESFCYANVKCEDKVSAKLRGYANHWRNIYGQDDVSIARLIQQDKIDILVDLAGHTAGNNLLTFAYQPAPVQVTWLGYPNTTGMQRMDYRITDAYVDPEDDNNPHSEQLVRLPTAFSCYQPHPDYPNVGELPNIKNQCITFGSFNNLAKVTDEVIAAWSALLQAVPDSRLILKNKALRDDRVHATFTQGFAQHGISNDRIELIAWTASMIDHMELYNRIDIALDTFPYNGATTTCESLYMGVPVICQYGQQHASRVSADFMQQVGLATWIAKDNEDYITKAVMLAQDIDTLATIRQKLRQNMLQSSLCDGERFAHDIEQAFREMWQRWCQKV